MNTLSGQRPLQHPAHAQAVAAVHDVDYTDGGNERMAKNAVLFYLEGTNNENMNLYYRLSDAQNGVNETAQPGFYSEEILRQFLDDGHVVYINRGVYEEGVRIHGHATVITGYTQEIVNGETEYHYIIHDPWPSPVPPEWDPPTPSMQEFDTNGTVYVVTYDWIRTSWDEENQVNWYWDGFLVCMTSYCGTVSEFIPPQ